jgi:hypothetical protein
MDKKQVKKRTMASPDHYHGIKKKIVNSNSFDTA